MRKESIVLDDMYFNIEDLLIGMKDYFEQQDRDFSVASKSSTPIVIVDGVKYITTIKAGGMFPISCQQIVLKEVK
jgi:hypothetical protein